MQQTKQCVTTFTFGEDLAWQQLGCLWQGETIMSASLNGFINYLDPAAPAAPVRSIQVPVGLLWHMCSTGGCSAFFAVVVVGILVVYLMFFVISWYCGSFRYVLTPNLRLMQGHSKYVTALAVDAAAGLFYSGDYEGRVVRTDLASGASTVLGCHGNAVAAALAHDGVLTTVACVRGEGV